MIRYIFIALLCIVFIGSSNVQAQNGFVVWAKGRDCDTELMFNRIENGQVGDTKIAVEKHVTDIWVNISYDGVWIAFCRVNEAFGGRYGNCDYHLFDKWDIYIAKIDNGNNLPAVPIFVGHGYMPSWGDDALYPDKPKTLYFTHYESKTIKKTIISPDGTFTPPEEYHKFDQSMGSNAHIQMSPNGKFLLYRPSQMMVFSLELEKNISGSLGGCHPSWGPRSRYFIRAKNGAFLNLGTLVKPLGPAGVGSTWQGISNDSYYDEGKLWVIGSISGGGMAVSNIVEFREIDISNGGWTRSGVSTKVGNGTSCDIHIWRTENTPVNSSLIPMTFKKSVEFNAKLSTGTAGMDLILESIEPAYSAELFDMKGRQRAFVRMRDKSQTIIPLRGIDNGIYIIQLNTVQGSTRKTLEIIR